MESLECRFRTGRMTAELICIVILCAFAGTWGVGALNPRFLQSDSAPIPGLALAAIIGLLMWHGRWRRRFVVDHWGVELRRSRNRVIRRLEWAEIDEIFLLGWAEFEIHGAGKSIRLSGPYDGLDRARERCAPRLTGIRDHLRTRALMDGQVEFRMPGGSWRAHLAYLGAVLILTTITGLCLAPLLKGRIQGFPIIFVLFGGSWLWSLRKRASGLGTRVTLHREGFVVRRLDGKQRVAWEDFDHSEWNDKDGLNLVLKSRRVLTLPPSLGNIAMLEEFLREGPPTMESGTLGEVPNRTMMQNP